MTVSRNIALYPWYKFFQNLIFWQAVWFLYFQTTLSAAEAILLYVVYDVTTTVFEVPSGYMSDRLGRRITLVAAALCGTLGCAMLALGDGFMALALGQVLLGGSAALASGTDSALLYESLREAGRQDETEAQELRAWRFTFVGLAFSAVIGGVMAQIWPVLPFITSAIAFAAAFGVAWMLREPAIESDTTPGEKERLRALVHALTTPVLTWFFALSVLMYGFSHIPFVFGQPFILEALDGAGLASEAPVVSGSVTAVMMTVSVGASLVAVRLKSVLGLTGILLLAFGMQVVLAGVLALTNSLIAIAFLFLRMVPDSLSRPFILARIQPLLPNETRATYLSLQSLLGRLVFALSLYAAAMTTQAAAEMPYEDIRWILAGYAVAGMVAWVTLALSSRRLTLDHTA